MTDQTSLLDRLDWRPGSRADSDYLRSLPPFRDWREDRIESRLRALELEARALVRSIDWRAAPGTERRRRDEDLWHLRHQLLKHICAVLLIARAPHLTNAKRLRLLDAFETCFPPRSAGPDGASSTVDREQGPGRFNAMVRDLARVERVRLPVVGRLGGWACGLCGLPVLQRAPRWLRTHPLGASVDHIVPVSRGGADALANVRLAHGWCNALRHDDTEDRRVLFASLPSAPLAGRVVSAVLEWEREYAGDFLAGMRRWLRSEERRRPVGGDDQPALLRKLRRDVAAEETRLADPARATWDRPDWYVELVRRAVIERAEKRGFCVTCLLASPWQHHPRFVRHRRPDFHPGASPAAVPATTPRS